MDSHIHYTCLAFLIFVFKCILKSMLTSHVLGNSSVIAKTYLFFKDSAMVDSKNFSQNGRWIISNSLLYSSRIAQQ